jgi:hypothetical protein
LDKKAILKRIIKENGDCTWINRESVDVCRYCPLSHNHAGQFISCLELIAGYEINSGLNTMSEETLNKLYLKSAIERLESMEIEDMLRGTDGYGPSDTDSGKDS